LKRMILLLFIATAIFGASSYAYAHGGGGVVDAPTYVRQSIAFLEGTSNVAEAEERINEALELNGETVNREMLMQARQALADGNMEEAKSFLVQSLGKQSATAEELALHPGFKGDAADYAVIVLGIVLIAAGGLFISSSKKNVSHRNGGISHG